MVKQTSNIYIPLDESLQLKSWQVITWISTNVANTIWQLFLEKNHGTIKNNNDKKAKVIELANKLKGLSNEKKVQLIITVNLLKNKKMLNPTSIKQIKIEWDNADDIVDNIIHSLMPQDAGLQANLNDDVIKSMNEFYRNNYEGVTDLMLTRANEHLKMRAKAAEKTNRIAENVVIWNKWWINRVKRVAHGISTTMSNKKLNPEEKARTIIRKASSLQSGIWRSRLIRMLRKMDVNQWYKYAAEALKDKMRNKPTDEEKVAIRFIMKNLNEVYKEYRESSQVSDSQLDDNMQDIDSSMLSAA